MDVKEIGQFLALLRKEKNLTQEQLGEKLGVNNKTVSRWENGNYLPPVEMLQCLSEMYGITINEILSARRLSENDFRRQAEENIKTALSDSPFTLEEKIDFYKKKWKKEHRWGSALTRLAICILLVVGVARDETLLIIGYFAANMAQYVIERNQMMAYVEDRAFDGTGR